MDQQMLLIDSCLSSCFELHLTESAKNGRTKFRGKFQEAEAVNKNKRIYPYDVLAENVSRLQEAISDRRLLGELDHPADSIIHFANASHIVTKLWWDGNVLMGEGEILTTPSGEVLRRIINDGVKVGISSRGVGNGKVNEEGILVIGESYKLITFDAVADPSCFEAYQKAVVKDETVRAAMTQRSAAHNSAAKNESSGIHTNNKDILVAYLTGIAKSHTEQLKSRLG